MASAASSQKHSSAAGDNNDVSMATEELEEKKKKKKNKCHHFYALPDGTEREKKKSGRGRGISERLGVKRARELDRSLHGTLDAPEWNGESAREYPFELDTFQEISVACLERRENVFVAAHTSAGKTAVAEYAIAMAFRDNQKVVYTSPLKALSNQKFRELQEDFEDVGLMTGDNSLHPNANCIVMTTEIMRSMIYKGSETMREVAWVIFDEVHYMKDKERGVVWEESIIFLPPQVKMVFLSATLSNANEFASWVATLRGEPCHVIYTDQRPVPLQHFGFPLGGDGMHLLCDEFGNFKSEAFNDLKRSFKETEKGSKGKGGKGGKGDEQDLFRLVKTLKDMEDLPIIVFSFSRRQCEESALKISKLDFTTDDDKEEIEQVFSNAIDCLNEEDRNLQAIEHMLPLLKKGIGIHHGGLLPILKELIEILFQEQLIKILFATETFAMGLNMPAKTVIFTAMKKWDGEANRYIASGEYIQMSGRAGRRGKDLRGNCIMMIDQEMDEATCAGMISGKPLPLISNYKLTYYTLLNLLRRVDGTSEQKKTIERSFHQYQHQSSVPALKKEIEVLKKEDSGTVFQVGSSKKCSDIGSLGKELKEYIKLQSMRQRLVNSLLMSDSWLQYLCAGRLVHIVDGTIDWGWGIVVSAFKKVRNSSSGNISDDYILDIILPCRKDLDEGAIYPLESLAEMASMEKSETILAITPVLSSCLAEISSLRVGLPRNLKDPEGEKKVQMTIYSIVKKYGFGSLPLLHPTRDMNLQDQEELWFDIIDMKGKFMSPKVSPHISGPRGPLERMRYSDCRAIKRKMEIESEISELEEKIKDSQVTVFEKEIKLRSAILKRLGHIDDTGVLQLKGRAACEIDTADELMASELMLEGAFNSLDIHQVVAVASCLVPVDRSQTQIDVQPALREPLNALKEAAKHIATISRECKLEIDDEEYVQSFKPTLMNVSYNWSKGKSFSEICEMTDIFEGSIIRTMRRLNELLCQLESASTAIGDQELAEKFLQASKSIQRGIIFAASLYI